MANNFRQVGNYYVSKSGSDSNSGTSPNAPFLTPFHNLAGTTIIGAGFYNVSINFSSMNINYNGDGIVILNSDGTPSFVISNGQTLSFNGIIIKNFDNSTSNSISGGFLGTLLQFTNCTLINCVFSGMYYNVQFTNCTLINCDFSLITQGYTVFNGCTVINSIINNVYTFINSYCNQSTTLYMYGSISSFDYNNINGKINFPTGPNAGTNITLAQQKTNYPSYNVNSFDLNPQFNNISKLDFSYAINSPNLNKGQGSVINIGSTNYGKGLYSISSNELNPINGAIVNNLVLNGNDYILSGATYGTVTTTPIAIASYVAEVQKINYLGYLFFDKSFSGGTDNNSNVPDYSTYLSGDTSGGGNPDRLSYRMRWSTSLIIPTVNNDWDNGGLISAGSMIEFEWGQKPLIDVSGRGNGNPAFNKVTAMPIGARWIQIEVTLRNNYNN